MQRRKRFISVLVMAMFGASMLPVTIPAAAAIGDAVQVNDEEGEYDDAKFNYSCGVNDLLLDPHSETPVSKQPWLFFFSNIAKKNGNTWYGKRPSDIASGNPTYYIAFLKNDKTGLKASDAGYKNPVFHEGPTYSQKDIKLVSTDNGQFGVQLKRAGGASIRYSVLDKNGLWCETAFTNVGIQDAELPLIEVNRYGVIVENKAGYGRERDRLGGPRNGGMTQDLWITFRSLNSGKPYTATVKVTAERRARVKLPRKLEKLAERYGSIEWQASFYPPKLQRSQQTGVPALLTYENPATWFTVKWTPKAKESARWMMTRTPFTKMQEGSSPSPVKAIPAKPRATLSVKKRIAVTLTLINNADERVKYKIRYRKAGTRSYRTIIRYVKPQTTRAVKLRVVKGSKVKVSYQKKSGAYIRLVNQRT